MRPLRGTAKILAGGNAARQEARYHDLVSAEASKPVVGDPFALLGVDRSFDVDSAAINANWLRMIADLHPDRSAGDPEAAQALAKLNEAKTVLLDPESRADALVVLLGGPRRDEHKELPAGFLMEMLEIREQVEGAAASGDAGEVASLRQWADAERDRMLAEIAVMFQSGTALEDVRTALNALRYIERMIEQVE